MTVHEHPPATSQEVWEWLQHGNQRYRSGHPLHPRQGAQRRAEVLPAQRPVAAILCCADSRVPPEIIFDQGVGDLFVVRTAGNLAGSEYVLGSLEFAAVKLAVPLLLVLGHQQCGAVAAAWDAISRPVSEPAPASSHLASMVDALRPVFQHVPGCAHAAAPSAADVPALLTHVVRHNISHQVRLIRQMSPLIAEQEAGGHLRIVGAYYSLESGGVELVEPDTDTTAAPVAGREGRA